MTGFAQTPDPELVEACGDSPTLICEWTWDRTGNEGITQLVDVLFGRPVTILLIVVIALVANRLLRRGIARFVDRVIAARDAEYELATRHDLVRRLGLRGREKLAESAQHAERAKQRAVTLGNVLRSLASIIVWGVATLLVLGELGINLAPLIAGAGIAGIAIGFGAQSLVADFLSGIFIVIEDQYGVGDIVDVGEAEGTIERVTLRTTWLRDVDGSLWVVPNSEIRRVGNKSQLWARAVVDVGVGYGADLDEATAVIKRAADELWRADLDNATILEEPEIWGVTELGDNSVSIRVAMKTEPSEQWQTARELRRRVKVALDESGIEIPFPQRTVWLASAPAPVASGAVDDGVPPCDEPPPSDEAGDGPGEG